MRYRDKFSSKAKKKERNVLNSVFFLSYTPFKGILQRFLHFLKLMYLLCLQSQQADFFLIRSFFNGHDCFFNGMPSIDLLVIDSSTTINFPMPINNSWDRIIGMPCYSIPQAQIPP